MEEILATAEVTENDNEKQSDDLKKLNEKRDALILEHKQKITALKAEHQAKLTAVDYEIKDEKLKYYEIKIKELEDALAQKKI